MFNVLSWNIQFFTERRVNDPGRGADYEEVQDNLDRTSANLNYIISTVQESAADIFVVLEPRCSQGTVEQLASGGGPAGLLFLLAQLRQVMPASNWCLVPPLRLNPRDIIGRISTYTECIGVFWADANLAFTGPYVWPGGNDGPPIAPGQGVTTGDYPAPWDGAVPGGLQAAARCRFYRSNGDEILYPDAESRRPFYTTFLERNAPNRTLRLFTMHTSPGSAQTGFARMLSVSERLPGINEVSLIVGDINLNLNKLTSLDAATLLSFQSDRFVPVYPPRVTYNKRYPTRVRPPTGRRGTANPVQYLTDEVLDFGLARRGQNVPVAPFTAQVVNRVAALPHPPFTLDMVDSLANLLNIARLDIRDTLFKWRWNYGHIAQPHRTRDAADASTDGTSDHLPILVSV